LPPAIGAFKVLYERTSAKLFSSIRRILINQAAAEDAAQDAYVRDLAPRRRLRCKRRLADRVMTTIAPRRHRRGARGAAHLGGRRRDRRSLADRLADPGKRRELLAATRLKSCLDKLDADRRGMVLLAYCYGWSREELARRFDRPVATVKTLLRRSLIALKDCLGG
jgi:RNA polymerase sigma-70 factor (ECF subfamily)